MSWNLSGIEERIIDLYCRGYTAKEIAEVRGGSVRTVELHIRSIKRKMGARTTPHAAAMFERQKWVLANIASPLPSSEEAKPIRDLLQEEQRPDT